MCLIVEMAMKDALQTDQEVAVFLRALEMYSIHEQEFKLNLVNLNCKTGCLDRASNAKQGTGDIEENAKRMEGCLIQHF